MSYETKTFATSACWATAAAAKPVWLRACSSPPALSTVRGKVSDSNTVCDYDAEEIKRQITISASIAPVEFGGCKINVLDCPALRLRR